MNLLIEQRPSTIPSSKSQSQSSPQTHEHQKNNSSSPIVLKIKRRTSKQVTTNDSSNSTALHMAEDDEMTSTAADEDDNRPSSRSTTQTSRLKRPNSTTSTRRPSSPAFNGKQQQQASNKRSLTIDSNNNDLPSNLEEISARKRFKSDDCNQSSSSSSSSSSSKADASVETVSVGLATEPDHLGPCEPGTSVVLEGIVWNETDSGVLVVNVTWRGKTYVGTLLDSTKQDWACPRLTCESPTSDYDGRIPSKTGRTKRNTAGTNSRSSNQQQSVSSFQQITSIILSSGIDDRRLRNNIKSRQSKRLNHLSNNNSNSPTTTATSADETTTANSSPLSSPYRTNQTFFAQETTRMSSHAEPQLIPCTEPNCYKRFASNVALTYHLSDAHQKSSMTSNTISQANTRDEEDVAHILANVAHYARRTSPSSSSIRSSPDHHTIATTMPSPNLVHSPPSNRTSSSTLTWPCLQISANFVQPSALNNDERITSPSAKISNSQNILENPIVQDENEHSHLSSITKNLSRKDQMNITSPPSVSSFVPISLPSTIPPAPSSPAYSDISDEETTTTTTTTRSNSHEQILPPSTINLLAAAATNGKLDENGNNLSSSGFLASNGTLNHTDLSNPAWTAQMLFQQLGSFMSQSALVPTATSIVPSNSRENNKKSRSTTPNGLNSKTSPCPSTNGTSDSTTVKNILDARRSSTLKSSPSPPMNLFHFHPNGNKIETKFSPSIINTLTSPNENLLHLANFSPSSSVPTMTTTTVSNNISTLKPMDILDYSFNSSQSTTSNGQYSHSSSLHPSR